MKKTVFLFATFLCLSLPALSQGGGNMGGGGGSNGGGDMEGGGGNMGGGGGGSSSSSTGAASATGYSQSSGTNSATGATYTSTNADENAVQITGGTFTMTDCTVIKSGGDTSDSDGSSFYGINSAVYCAGNTSTLYIEGGTVSSSATGANGIMAYDSGTVYASDVTVTTSSNLSRGIHATGGGVINASNLHITTASTNCSVIATDRGGGTVTVEGGTYTTTGDDSAITYSTGTIAVSDATGSSSKGEIAVIEGDNSITLTNCVMTSGSSSRGMMILQSGSGDSEGYNGKITVNGGTMTTTDSGAPLLEVPTDITATLTLNDVSLDIAGGVLMYVNYNTRWTTCGGTGILVMATDSSWTYTGDVNADKYSTAQVNVGSGVTWNGALDNGNTAKATSVTVEGKWVLTDDSYVDDLTIEEGGVVDTFGHSLSYGTLTNNGKLTDGIATIRRDTTASSSGAVYTIDGKRVDGIDNPDNLSPGIYIYQGKKVTITK